MLRRFKNLYIILIKLKLIDNFLNCKQLKKLSIYPYYKINIYKYIFYNLLVKNIK